MLTLSLNGAWKVSPVPCGSDITSMLSPSFLPEGFLDAHVSEDIHASLRRAGAIRGNTYNKREDEEQWIEERDWVYIKAFHVAPEAEGQHLQLVCEGLDTFCEVYLNGRLLGVHQNMFTPCSLDLTGRLLIGQRNVLLIRFFSAARFVAGRDERRIFSITTSDRIFARKAQMNYSWDFCGRWVTLGIWKPIRIAAVPQADILSCYARTESADPDRAVITLETELRLPADAQGAYTVQASLPGRGRSGRPRASARAAGASCAWRWISPRCGGPALWAPAAV